MSSVDLLLGDLKAKGIELWVEADRLRFRAPEGAMTPDVRDAVTAAKPALIAALRSAAREQLRSAPLSYNQQALFFLNQHAPESAAYNIGFAIRIKSAVNHDALRHAVQALVDRHDTLRTTYELRDTGPVQIIAGSVAVPVTVVNAAGMTESELSDRVHDAFRAPFDLKAGPVVRFHLFTVNSREHVLLGSVHHIAADGWSIWILLDELRQLYAAHATGQPATLRRAATTYLDFVESQKASVESADGQAMWDYWRGQLAGELTALDLPGDRPRPRVMRYVGDTIEVSLPEAVVSGVKRVAREQGTTAFAVLLAAFNAVMARYTGKSDVIVGTPVFGRSHAEFQSVVGDFVNSVVLRSQVAGERTFREHVGEASATVRNAIENGECPFPVIVQRLGVQRDPARPPIFQVMLILQKPHRSSDFARLFTPGGGAIDFGGLQAEGYSLAHQEGQVDLTLELAESGASIVGGLKYNTDLFDRSSARRLRDHFARLLAIAVEHPEERIDRLAGRMLADDERSLMFDTWNATTRDIPAADPARLFDQQAARRPDAVAIEAVDGSLTYAELEARSNRLAHRLRTLGVGPGGLVGIGLNRTQHLPVAVLGVLKSGAAYVPLDPSFPAQRLAWMLEDAAPPVLVTEQALAGTWPASGATLLCLDDESLGLENEPASAPLQVADADDLAYVIFTSGSTGRPKGVEIPRVAVTNFLESMAREPGCGPEDRLLAVTTLSFDIAVLELLLPLVTGGTVVLATREDAVDGERLRAMIESRRITLMQATPATWRLLGDAGWTGTPGLTVLCGGEALPADLAERLIDQASVVWNMYGPTETTVWSTLGRVSRGAAITIGRPIDNTRIYVLGPERAPVPVGVTGELWIGGAGLARGYLGQPDLTNERFVPDPFVAGGRMYRTGDLARWTASGELEHLGRVDAQVKVRGFRIELGDVEAALSAAVDGALAAVAAVSTAGDTRLVGCVVSASIDGAAIRQAMRARLPEYMVPSAIVTVESLPRTANGKLDRNALAATARSLVSAHSASADADAGQIQPTPMEDMLMAIWADVLGVERVGREDDFFDLGGHSLIATRLMKQLSDVFWVDLSVRMLFDAPTVAALAAVIVDRMETKRQQESRPVATVAEINTSGSKPPFFFLHAAMQGDGFYCYNLARHLGEDQPMYALPPLGLDGNPVPPTIESMAAAQRQVIRRIQPSGPYFVGGFCFAGGVALEVARQLRAEGEQVALVVAIETRIHPPILLNRVANRISALRARLNGWSPRQQAVAAGRLRPFVYAVARLFHNDSTHLMKRLAGSGGIIQAARNFLNPPRLPAAAAPAVPVTDPLRASVMRSNEVAFNGYVPRRYDGRIECIWAEAEEFHPFTWKMLGAQVRFTPVQGNHNTCVTTQVASLSGALARALREAQEAASPQTAATPSKSPLKFRRSTAGIASVAKSDARSGRASIVAPTTKATAR